MAATESAAPDAYREILIESGGDDIVLTFEVTGIPSNMLRLSLERSGFVGGGDHQKFDLARELDTIKAWKDVWAGGHGVSDVTESAPLADLIRRFSSEYEAARNESRLRSAEHTSELQSPMRS